MKAGATDRETLRAVLEGVRDGSCTIAEAEIGILDDLGYSHGMDPVKVTDEMVERAWHVFVWEDGHRYPKPEKLRKALEAALR